MVTAYSLYKKDNYQITKNKLETDGQSTSITNVSNELQKQWAKLHAKYKQKYINDAFKLSKKNISETKSESKTEIKVEIKSPGIIDCQLLKNIMTSPGDIFNKELYHKYNSQFIYIDKFLENLLQSFDVISGGLIRMNEKGIVKIYYKHNIKNKPMFFMVSIKFKDKEVGHANTLLINPKNLTIELFEPHGTKAKWTHMLYESLENQLSKDFIGYTFIQPLDYCPVNSLQSISGDAYCQNWSTLYTALRFACPDIPRDKLINELLSYGKGYLELLMIKWGNYQYNAIYKLIEEDRALRENIQLRKTEITNQILNDTIIITHIDKHFINDGDALVLTATPEQIKAWYTFMTREGYKELVPAKFALISDASIGDYFTLVFPPHDDIHPEKITKFGVYDKKNGLIPPSFIITTDNGNYYNIGGLWRNLSEINDDDASPMTYIIIKNE